MISEGDGGATSEEIASAAKNVQSLGFGLSTPILECLSSLSSDELASWYSTILPILQKLVGAHRTFNPMYPNFPKQVMEASDAELYFNAITHYFGFIVSDAIGDPSLVVLPNYVKEARPLLEEFHTLRWIELGSEEDFSSIFTNLAASNSSISKSDKDILDWFASHRDVSGLIPEKIPQKETLAFLVASLPQPDCLIPAIKTATDVLRVAVVMSDGDASLAEPTKFRNFSKRERRFLLGCLENSGSSRTEDMLRWKDRWIRLGERLHPGDFKKKFPKSFDGFDILRNNKPFKTFNGKIEEAIREGIPQTTIQLLVQRPGDFARRLDHVLRSYNEQDSIVKSFLEIASQVSTPVLLQTWCHFQIRDVIENRAFFPKGNAAKVQVKDGPLAPLAEGISEAVHNGVREILLARFTELPSLGKVYLDERLKNQIVPFSQRSASRSLRAISRGSRFDLPEGDTIRFFCWWKNIDADDEWASRVDLDLSASFFDENWESQGDISYYNLRDGQCYHSGDITSAPEGACEFIDVNLPSALQMKARYVVMSVLSYSGQPYVSLPECFGGWMVRKKPNSGEVFEPKTVQDKIDITSPSRACVPLIIDALNRKVYWADLGLKSYAQINNAHQNSVGFSQIGRAILELNKPTLFDLFLIHAEARGEIVDSIKDAETVFGLHEGTVSAFDTDIILSQYLA
ncbi:MAG: cytoplasmic protein [Gimesia sp.]|nr:cytoplasmic protein [Gimesia sp.]